MAIGSMLPKLPTRYKHSHQETRMPTKTAEAVWNGTLTEGKGHLKTQSGKLDTDYGWKSRSEDGQPGTNPEELIAAAHAGCFSMAFSHILAGAGFTAKTIN